MTEQLNDGYAVKNMWNIKIITVDSLHDCKGETATRIYFYTYNF